MVPAAVACRKGLKVTRSQAIGSQHLLPAVALVGFRHGKNGVSRQFPPAYNGCAHPLVRQGRLVTHGRRSVRGLRSVGCLFGGDL
jgi:hypothetical protein